MVTRSVGHDRDKTRQDETRSSTRTNRQHERHVNSDVRIRVFVRIVVHVLHEGEQEHGLQHAGERIERAVLAVVVEAELRRVRAEVDEEEDHGKAHDEGAHDQDELFQVEDDGLEHGDERRDCGFFWEVGGGWWLCGVYVEKKRTWEEGSMPGSRADMHTTPTLQVNGLHVAEDFDEQPRHSEHHGGDVGRSVLVRDQACAVREHHYPRDDRPDVDPVPQVAAPRFGEAEEGEGVVDRRVRIAVFWEAEEFVVDEVQEDVGFPFEVIVVDERPNLLAGCEGGRVGPSRARSAA